MLEVLFSFVMAFGLSYIALPIVIRVARLQGLLDQPDDHRKAHSTSVPLFGGIGIFVSVLLVLLLWTPDLYFDDLRYILCALVIMFLVGAKDDIDPISPLTKLMGQLVTVAVLIMLADIRITGFHGLLGVHAIPYWLSIFISVLFFILVINSFNLIDGIDGLASSLALIACAAYGTWFFLTGYYSYSIFSFAVAGATLAFFKFNITPAQIFMGDTGSLVLGTVCAVLTVLFMETNGALINSTYQFTQGPIIAFALIIVPVFDTLRVFVYRLRRGQSPFIPDRNHIHHLLLRCGLTHLQATFSLVLITVAFLLSAIYLPMIDTTVLMILMIILCSVMTTSIEWYIAYRDRALVRS